jgi:predicted DNA-binding transcriptional regulator AlpA
MDAIKINRLLRLAEVSELTSLGKSTINLWVAKGKFPAPTALSSTIKVWRQSDVDAWIEAVIGGEGKTQERRPSEDETAQNVYPLTSRATK